MAHSFKVDVRPAKNKDGSDSKRKKIYRVTDRHRKHRIVLGEVHTLSEVDELINTQRANAHAEHLKQHPNDMAFRRKHRL